MRALLVCAAPSEGYEDLVRAEAVGLDLVIAVDGGADLCARASVVPNLVVGDFDSVSSETVALLSASPTVLIQLPAEKDETDLDVALAEARRRGASQVVVCAAFSGRLDHTLAAIGSLSRAADLSPVIVEPRQRGWILSAEHRPTLDVGPRGTTCSILALGADVEVSATGVRWPLDHEPLGLLGSRGVSNLVTHSSARFQLHRGVALIINPAVR